MSEEGLVFKGHLKCFFLNRAGVFSILRLYVNLPSDFVCAKISLRCQFVYKSGEIYVI